MPPGAANARAREHGVLVRSWRIVCVIGVLAKGLAVALLLLDRADVRLRNRHMQPWCASLLHVFGIQVTVLGAPPTDDAPVFIAANHVSWLDIWVLNTACPTLFVAKSEIRRWPLVGWLANRVGTLFIERARRADTLRVNDHIVARLAIAGERVSIFPEGTTTDGSVVRPFHASLFQPAVSAQARVYPVAIRYVDTHGGRSTIPAYVDDMTLATSMWRIAGGRGLRAELHFLQPIEPGQRTRRELAALSQERVAAAISGSS
jgi:1-acyl-sn-glycerol-3-phosphate acyltransferase